MTSEVELSSIQTARVLVVVVNYKTAHLAIECLASLETELRAFPSARVTVVDNLSNDGSFERLQSAIVERGWSSWVSVHASPLNGGFSYGNNQAIRPALASSQPPDFVWLLNPDTEARPGALTELLAYVLPRPEIGIAGGSYEEADGSPWPYAFRFPSLLSELDRGLRWGLVTRLLHEHVLTQRMSDEPSQVGWLAGASLLIRREVFERVGLMDEGYFLYFEETDFCLQATRAGFQCWYVPASRVMHIAGQSTGVTDRQQAPKRMPDYWFESRTRYFTKNHGRLYGAATDLVCAAGFALWRLRRPLQGKPDTDPPRYLFDFLRHSAVFNSSVPRSRMAQGSQPAA